MARVTVEDAVSQVGNRFDLILLASKRARQLAIEGKEPMVEAGNDKPTVLALREIEQRLVTAETVEQDNQIDEQQNDMTQFAAVVSAIGE